MDFENIFENIKYQEFFFVYLSNTEEQSQSDLDPLRD